MQLVNFSVDKQKLANTLASYFNDNQNLGQYLAYCNKYDASVINRAFNEVKHTKEQRSKSPNALFFYLVKKYAHQA